MRVTTATISNFTGLLITGALLTLWALMPSASESAGAGEAAGEMTVALEAEPVPEPPAPAPPAEPEKVAEQPPPAEPVPEPVPPPVPEPPPPPPEPEPPPEKEEEAQPAEQLLDEDGAPIKPPPQALVEANEEQASAFKKCLLNRTYYPSTREARKLKPHGVVGLKFSSSTRKSPASRSRSRLARRSSTKPRARACSIPDVRPRGRCRHRGDHYQLLGKQFLGRMTVAA